MTPAQIAKKGGLSVTKIASLTKTPLRTLYDIFNRDVEMFTNLAVKARTELYDQDLARVTDSYNQDIKQLTKELRGRIDGLSEHCQAKLNNSLQSKKDL